MIRPLTGGNGLRPAFVTGANVGVVVVVSCLCVDPLSVDRLLTNFTVTNVASTVGIIGMYVGDFVVVVVVVTVAVDAVLPVAEPRAVWKTEADLAVSILTTGVPIRYGTTVTGSFLINARRARVGARQRTTRRERYA